VEIPAAVAAATEVAGVAAVVLAAEAAVAVAPKEAAEVEVTPADTADNRDIYLAQ
jgi:hypothetical protein